MIGKFVLLVGFILSLCFVGIAGAQETSVTLPEDGSKCLVVSMEDGDTFNLLCYETSSQTFRANLKGFDAAGWEERGGDCYAKEAAMWAAGNVLHEEVVIIYDKNGKTDGKRRLLVYMTLHKKDVAETMLAMGFGWVPRKWPADRKEMYMAFEKSAREAKFGIWGNCSEEYLSFRPKMN